MMKKKQYEAPSIEIIEFETSDAIAASTHGNNAGTAGTDNLFD